jgi:hypothetical protein
LLFYFPGNEANSIQVLRPGVRNTAPATAQKINLTANAEKRDNIRLSAVGLCILYALARQTGTCGRVDANPFLTKTHEDFFRKTCRGQA